MVDKKILDNFLRESVVLVLGKSSEVLADLLNSKKYVNEFILAKKLEVTINQMRNLLYKLSDKGIVSSERKKDKKKGWYTYFWRLESFKVLSFLKNHYLKRIEQVDYQITSRETKQFYICERCNIEYAEENALLLNFTCPECGGIFALRDNSKLLKELHKNKERFEENIKLIDMEMEIIQEKDSKVLEKRRTKEAEEKKVVRKKKLAERKVARGEAAKSKVGTKKKVSKKEGKVKSKKVAVKKTVKGKVVKKIVKSKVAANIKKISKKVSKKVGLNISKKKKYVEINSTFYCISLFLTFYTFFRQ